MNYNPTIPFNVRIAQGEYANISYINKFGFNPDLTMNTAANIWYGTGLYTFLSAADTLDIVSDDADDDATPGPGGTGARSLRLFGLNGSFDEITEDINLNGLTPVTTVNSFRRLFRAQVLSAGSSETNEGTITIATNTGGTLQATIQPLKGQTQLGLYTIPNGKIGLLQQLNLSIEGPTNGEITFELFRRDTNGAVRLQNSWLTVRGGDSKVSRNYEVMPVYEATEDIYFIATSSASNMQCEVDFDMWIIDA